MIIDVREKGDIVNDEDHIVFDHTGDYLYCDGATLVFRNFDDGSDTYLCLMSEIDVFIRAVKKSKEIWGDK